MLYSYNKPLHFHSALKSLIAYSLTNKYRLIINLAKTHQNCLLRESPRPI